MKKVLFFLESLAGGGAEKVLADLVTHLDPEKFDVTVITVTDEDIYQPQVEAACRYRSFLKMADLRRGGLHGVLFRLRIRMIYWLPPRLVHRRYIREKYDVEAAFIEGFATKLIAASPDPDSRKLAWVHIDMKRNGYAERSFRSHEAHCRAYHRFDRILCVSDSVRQAFEEVLFASPKVTVQYNPVDDRVIFDLSLRPVELSRPSGLLLCSVGRLEEQKGYPRLVRAAAAAKEKGYPMTLWILGKGSQQAELEALIRDLGMEDNVKLLGFQRNPYPYLRMSDGFICSSYAEGFSTAATEALILGRPIFTTDCAGMAELFGGECCGIIAENTDESLFSMVEELAAGRCRPSDYAAGVEARRGAFALRRRMEEVEALLLQESDREEEKEQPCGS